MGLLLFIVGSLLLFFWYKGKTEEEKDKFWHNAAVFWWGLIGALFAATALGPAVGEGGGLFIMLGGFLIGAWVAAVATGGSK